MRPAPGAVLRGAAYTDTDRPRGWGEFSAYSPHGAKPLFAREAIASELGARPPAGAAGAPLSPSAPPHLGEEPPARAGRARLCADPW